ncbi:multicopper oxidase domain-containing protein [Pseudomonas jinjuensis]|uniref:Multicopper oxidase with three cupredoxin domains (Includes cell division protein FtsP and spore coat protein CotA) n=1 Tax=Pseudomonas jinjuensis TaxID=198616 RepID=A0A1H0I311_9PSED|nr:Multicopper oxidase with three cupredoxin domains (includes cell division protein FtsP and spore coat protein CotA) [Pseudomonas jinjuensis]
MRTLKATKGRARAETTTRSKNRESRIVPGAFLLLGLSVAVAAASLDYFGSPPPGDPSAYTDAPKDPAAVLLQGADLANAGAFVQAGGVEGNRKTPLKENVLPPNAQTSFKIPTNGKPSPLFGAQPFTQSLLLFEEFGPEPFEPNPEPYPGIFPLPKPGYAPEQDPIVARSSPRGVELDAFLSHPGLYPLPTEYANDRDRNPWSPQVSAFLKRIVYSPAEGRPPGRGWAHQRYNEFYPQGEFKTVQAGARVNNGPRDSYQLHGYAGGEFGPGGLYYSTLTYQGSLKVPGYRVQGSTKGIGVRFHPEMPVQNHKSLWTFDGTLPPKLLMVRYGQPIVMRHYNALPIDPAANMGFGIHTISTHEHNGHNPAESDGYTNAFFFPGQYYDYRWPLQLAGYDSINTTASDPRAAFPCEPGETLYVNDANPGLKQCMNGRINIRGDWRETMSTHWYHDHMLDFTAQNVYKGNAAMMNYYSAIDRGYEGPLMDQYDPNLRFPSGTARSWGNRDYDVNLLIADKAWDKNGQLWFNPFNTDGFLGDQLLVNWQYKPYMDVRARSYRFRILNGSVSRYFKLAIVKEVKGTGGEFKGPSTTVSYSRVPFHMIGNDGNIMEHAIPFDGTMDLNGDGDLKDNFGILPVQGIAERYDIIVNFGKNGLKAGDKIYFVNLMEHDTGRGTKQVIPLADVLSGKYKPVIKDADKPDKAKWENGDPGVGIFMQMRVYSYGGQDLAMNPVDYEPAKPAVNGQPAKPEGKKMIPLHLDRDSLADKALLAQARHRTFIFGRSNGTDEQPWTIKTDGGDGYQMDPRRLTAAIQLASGPTKGGAPTTPGTLEIWRIENGGDGWEHPVHVHFEEGIILSRDGKMPPVWERWARKDVYRIGGLFDSSEVVEVALRFREFAGTYMEHCHNTQHEDTSMLLRWDAEYPGQVQLMPAPLPTWDGVTYAPSVALPTFRKGDGKGPQAGN